MQSNLFTKIEQTDVNVKFEKYLLQINRTKLIDYIQHGLIMADKYLSNECEKDIQSKNKDFLVLSDGYIQELDEHQILLDLVLREDEKEKLLFVNDVCYLEIPLPITRIKKVYAIDKKIVEHIEASIKSSECGFLPSDLFDTCKKANKIIFDSKNYSPLVDAAPSSDYTEQTRMFDKRLGMLSFMKNTHLYYSKETHVASNYSKHYFSTLSWLLKETLEDKSFMLFDILKSEEAFKKLVYSDKQIDKEFLEEYAIAIDEEEQKNLFKQLYSTPTGTRSTLQLLLEKGELKFYLIGLVYYFKQKNANRKDSFKIDIKSLIPSNVAEISLAILGIYLGYKSLRASENIEINDKIFKKIFGNSFPLKFTLDSKLSYITVETVYGYCFKGKEKGYEFNYLPYPHAKLKDIKIQKDDIFKRWYEVTENKEYFDVKHISVKKKSFEDIVDKQLEKYPDTLNTAKGRHLVAFISKEFPSLLSPLIFGEKIEISCKKDDFKEVVKSEKFISKRDKLLDLIDIDGAL